MKIVCPTIALRWEETIEISDNEYVLFHKWNKSILQDDVCEIVILKDIINVNLPWLVAYQMVGHHRQYTKSQQEHQFSTFKHQFISLEVNSVIKECDPNLCGQASHIIQIHTCI